MARTLNPQDYAKKRAEILAAAQQLVFAKGYERMTIQDLLAALNISSGAFYHYFVSKQAVLEALAEQLQDAMAQQLTPLAHDPLLPPEEKLTRFFAGLLRRDLPPAAQALVIALLRVWFTDENALLRHKVDEARVRRLAPLLAAIVAQGAQAGSFQPAHPDPALTAELLLALIQGLEYTLARRYAAYTQTPDAARFVADSVAAYDAYLSATERLLGLAAPLLPRLDPAVVEQSLALNTAYAAPTADPGALPQKATP